MISVQTFALPVYCQESFSQVSWPTSPGSGIEWNVQRSSPVTGSKPRTSPGGASGWFGASDIDAPTITVSRQTMTGELTA